MDASTPATPAPDGRDADRADPADRVEGTDRAEPTDPADRSGRAEGTDRAEPTDPAGRSDRAEGTDRAERARRCVPVELRDYVEFSREEATRIRVLWTPRLALELWCIEPMQATHVLHYEAQDVTYTVVGGRSWFVTDEGEVGLDPMGALQVPAGVVHGIDNRAPDPLIVLATVSPPGDERPGAPVADDAVAIRAREEMGPLGRAWRSLLGRNDG